MPPEPLTSKAAVDAEPSRRMSLGTVALNVTDEASSLAHVNSLETSNAAVAAEKTESAMQIIQRVRAVYSITSFKLPLADIYSS